MAGLLQQGSGVVARRLCLGALALASACAAGALSNGGATAAAPQERPNIVVVLTDDQTVQQLSSKSMPFTQKTLAKGGTEFTDAVVSTPLCCPARASFLTGQYAHNHGAWNTYRTFERASDHLATWLGDAGYRTAMVGKYLNQYEDVASSPTKPAPGWDQWRMLLEPLSYYDYDVAVNGERRHRGSRDNDYATTYLNHEATELVKRWAPSKKPFFLWYAPHAPHDEKIASKGRCRGRAVPGPRDQDLYGRFDLPKGPSFNEREISDKPGFIRSLPRLDRDEVRELEHLYRCRSAALREVDRGVADIVRELRRRNELDESVIVMASDNGLFHGEHRLEDGKRLAYAEAVDVPLLMKVPSQFAGGATIGKVTQPVANIDLAPTLLELAGEDPCVGGRCQVMDGRSLIPLLRGNTSAWPADRGRLLEMRNCHFTGLLGAGEMVVHYASIPRRPGRRGCIHRDAYERYRLGQDPYQLKNLADRVDDIPDERRQRMNRLRDCVGIEGRDPAPPSGSIYCE